MGEKEMVERQEWGEMRTFQGSVIVQKEEKALGVAAGWKDRGNTTWTDDSRTERGRFGAAVV